MDKPEDVSAAEMAAAELVWNHTGEICDGTNGSLIADIARAIMAAKAEEREACELIAQDWIGGAEYIAAAIRKRGEA